MRGIVCPVLRVVAVLAVSASVALAQTETLLYDHVHMSVPDPQASAQWFHDHSGGEWVDGRTDRLLFGTTRIMWLGSRGEERRPSAGGVIDHLGFSFANLSAKLAEVDDDTPGARPPIFASRSWVTRMRRSRGWRRTGSWLKAPGAGNAAFPLRLAPRGSLRGPASAPRFRDPV